MSHSPKNPYRLAVYFDNAIPDLGSTLSETHVCIEHARSAAARIRETYGRPCHCIIMHNKVQYPSFEWETVETFDL